jgi:hypothetical protein
MITQSSSLVRLRAQHKPCMLFECQNKQPILEPLSNLLFDSQLEVFVVIINCIKIRN